MSSPNHYKPNLRDLSFNLFEFLDIGRTSLGKGPFGGPGCKDNFIGWSRAGSLGVGRENR